MYMHAYTSYTFIFGCVPANASRSFFMGEEEKNTYNYNYI